MRLLRSTFEQLGKRRAAFRRLLVLVVLNVLVFAAFTYRLANKQERLARAQTRLTAELEEKTDELEALRADANRLTQNASAVTEFWNDTVRNRVPGLTEAWEEIDRLANETRVEKGRTAYDRDLLDVGLEQIKATMPVEGSYFDLVRFINRLERSPRFFLVEEVQLSQGAQRRDTIRLACSISFYLKAPPATSEAGP